MTKAVTGLATITTAKKDAYDALVVKQGELKVAADAVGMDDSAVLAAFTKTMAVLKSTLDDAISAQATAKLAWDAAVTEKTRMAATDKINKQWETDAKAAFKVVDDKYTGDLKQLKVYEGLDADTVAKK